MSFQFFNISTNIYINILIFPHPIVHNFFKAQANLFLSLEACQLVRPDFGIHNLPGSTFWGPGNLFILTCIQQGVYLFIFFFPSDNRCDEVGRNQGQCVCFFKCNIHFWLSTSKTFFFFFSPEAILKFNPKIILPVLFPKPH